MKMNSESIQVKAKMSETKGPHLLVVSLNFLWREKGAPGGGDLHYIC